MGEASRSPGEIFHFEGKCADEFLIYGVLGPDEDFNGEGK